jgi:hypothetical protein
MSRLPVGLHTLLRPDARMPDLTAMLLPVYGNWREISIPSRVDLGSSLIGSSVYSLADPTLVGRGKGSPGMQYQHKQGCTKELQPCDLYPGESADALWAASRLHGNMAAPRAGNLADEGCLGHTPRAQRRQE